MIEAVYHRLLQNNKEAGHNVLQPASSSVCFHSITFFPEDSCIFIIPEPYTTFFEFQSMDTIKQGCKDDETELSWNPDFISSHIPPFTTVLCLRTLMTNIKRVFRLLHWLYVV